MASSHMQSTRQQQPGQGQQQHQAPTYRGYRRHNLIGYTFQVRNRYTCLEPLGRGAYGLVAKARDLVGGFLTGCVKVSSYSYKCIRSSMQITGRHVAIKQIGNLFRHNIDGKHSLEPKRSSFYLLSTFKHRARSSKANTKRSEITQTSWRS